MEETPFIKMRKAFLAEKDEVVNRYEAEIKELNNRIMELEMQLATRNSSIKHEEVKVVDPLTNVICSECSFEFNIEVDPNAKQEDGTIICEICRGDFDNFF